MDNFQQSGRFVSHLVFILTKQTSSPITPIILLGFKAILQILHTFKKKRKKEKKQNDGEAFLVLEVIAKATLSPPLYSRIYCVLCAHLEKEAKSLLGFFFFGRFAAADKGTTCMIYSSHRCLIWPTSVARSALTRGRDAQIQADYYRLWL